ncbi:MAG: pantoate--beta-alanine ligase [Thiotrichales bacterium]|nr:pantoate--beta-alanine ligase [Thiotrichales bacterium]
MQVFKTIKSLREQVQAWKSQGLTVGFVPTMGNLHAGHLSLIHVAREQCDRVIASIFVNPLQFGPNEDFDSYPRTFDADQSKLKAQMVDGLFFPSVDEMYPSGEIQTTVHVPAELTGLLEGASRPGHFDGVTTVVNKLFNMVQPDVAVFGQKDFQQFAVISKMVTDLAMPVKLIRAPIGRDEDGLALSSRNQYLTQEQRAIAPKLYTTLLDIELAIKSGNRDFTALTMAASKQLLLHGFDFVDYIHVVNPITLMASKACDGSFVILAVAKLGNTRLLDNILLSKLD